MEGCHQSRKHASEVASFRPNSLTSCIAELLERILARRIYHIAETTNMFSKLQAGFRKGRSCGDNITRLIQKIMDGFDQKPCMHRSVFVSWTSVRPVMLFDARSSSVASKTRGFCIR